MLSKSIEQALNEQLSMEATASMNYLAMAVWAETNGLNGVAGFFYNQSDEERIHMLKLVKFINERGGVAIVPALNAPRTAFKDIHDLFKTFMSLEMDVTENVSKIVYKTLEEKNYTVHNFMQWYVSEQAEEEALARTILDKLKIIGNNEGALYLFDKDIEGIVADSEMIAK